MTLGERRFGCLAGSLALAIVLHHVWWSGFVVADRRVLVVLAALWCLAQPRSVGRFVVLLAAVAIHAALSLPRVGDHVLLVAVVGVSVLAVIAHGAVRTRALPEAGALFEAIAPLLRAAIVVVYASAAFAKLNSDFLDPASSYAVSMAVDLVGFQPGPVIWATLGVELSLPVLLLVRRTRTAGLVLGVSFHLVLALAGNVPFAAVALAFYVAFLPPGAGVPVVPRLPVAVGTGAWLALAALAPAAAVGGGPAGLLARALIVVWAAAALVTIVRARPFAPVRARLAHPALAAGLAVLVLNAATPYVGVRTPGTFTMFSNLRTEPGTWNHLVVPERLRVFAS